jgi:hypothetical protein
MFERNYYVGTLFIIFLSFTGCGYLKINAFGNIQKRHHVLQNNYSLDTLNFELLLYCPIISNRTIRNHNTGYLGVVSRDSVTRFDGLSVMIKNALDMNNVLIKMNDIRVVETKCSLDVRKYYKYSAIPDDEIIRLSNNVLGKTSISIGLIHNFRLLWNDIGLQQVSDLYLKVCIIESGKIIYSKYFNTEKISEEFTRKDTDGYNSIRDFFDDNGHSQYFNQEDWNRIIEFALKEYKERLR